jgi:hypothetical protein
MLFPQDRLEDRGIVERMSGIPRVNNLRNELAFLNAV